MRKIKIIVIMCCIILGTCVGCGVSQKDYDKLQTEKNELDEELTTNEQSTMEDEDTNNTEINLPDGFTKISLSVYKLLPDIDSLENNVKEALEEIGVQEVDGKVYGNYEEIGSVFIAIDTYVMTDVRNLIVNNQYLNNKWNVIYIIDADTKSTYYPITGKSVYDYVTGERINPQDETGTEDESVINIATDNIILEVNEKEIQEQKEIESTINEVLSETEEIEEISSLDVTIEKVSELTFDGESVIDVAIRDMKEYEYIKDVYIDIDESEKQINIVVQIPLETDVDTGRMAGEDVARYLASLASWSSEGYSGPSSDDLGGIYNKYNLLIYVDDGNHAFDIYGAKVTTARKITWR